MFYDTKLMKSKTIGTAWLCANKLCESSQSSSTSLAKTCSYLEKWVKSEEPEPSKRLSLRTSATLVAGAASLYKRKLEELLTDLQYTEESMRGPKSRRSWSYQGSTDLGPKYQDSDDQVSDDEVSDVDVQDSKGSGFNTVPSRSISERGSSTMPSHFQDTDPVNREEDHNSADDVEKITISAGDSEDGSPGIALEHCDEDKSTTENSHNKCTSLVKTKNAYAQTSSPADLNYEDSNKISKGDEVGPQPFMCAMIFGSDNTSMASGIIVSPINPEFFTSVFK